MFIRQIKRNKYFFEYYTIEKKTLKLKNFYLFYKGRDQNLYFSLLRKYFLKHKIYECKNHETF